MTSEKKGKRFGHAISKPFRAIGDFFHHPSKDSTRASSSSSQRKPSEHIAPNNTKSFPPVQNSSLYYQKSTSLDLFMQETPTPTPDETTIPSCLTPQVIVEMANTATSNTTSSIDGHEYVSPYRLHDRPTPLNQIEEFAELQEVLGASPMVYQQVTGYRPSPIVVPEDIANLCRGMSSYLIKDDDMLLDQSDVTIKMENPILIDQETQPIYDQMRYQLPHCHPLTNRNSSMRHHDPRMQNDISIKNENINDQLGRTRSSPSVLGQKKSSRRKYCTADGCSNLSRSKGLCKAHGGGRRCSIEGCSRASQSGSLCISHGGGKRCSVEGCSKAAQSKGMCKAHGGGVRCRADGCLKSSQGDGFCRTHGGGRRCSHPSGCGKWAQRNGMCMVHSEGKYGNSYRGRMKRLQEQQGHLNNISNK